MLVEPEGAGFSARFPSQPEHQVERTASASGVEAELQQWALEDELQRGVLMISYRPFVESLDDRGDPKRALKRIVTEQASKPGFEVLAERELSAGSYPGRELRARFTRGSMAGAEVRARFYIAGGRLYQVMAIARDEPQRVRAGRFLAGFALTEAASAAAASGARDLWKLREAPGGRFSVALPGEPERGEGGTRPTPWGARPVQSISGVGRHPAARYRATEIGLTEDEARSGRYSLLDRWQADRLAAAGEAGTLKRRVSVKVQGLHGRTLEIEVSRSGEAPLTRRHLGLVGSGRFYSLDLLPEEEAVGQGEARRFFDSFRLGAP